MPKISYLSRPYPILWMHIPTQMQNNYSGTHATSKQGNSEEIYREIIYDNQPWQYNKKGFSRITCSVWALHVLLSNSIHYTQQFTTAHKLDDSKKGDAVSKTDAFRYVQRIFSVISFVWRLSYRGKHIVYDISCQ